MPMPISNKKERDPVNIPSINSRMIIKTLLNSYFSLNNKIALSRIIEPQIIPSTFCPLSVKPNLSDPSRIKGLNSAIIIDDMMQLYDIMEIKYLVTFEQLFLKV